MVGEKMRARKPGEEGRKGQWERNTSHHNGLKTTIWPNMIMTQIYHGAAVAAGVSG
jgi:hypothetical protein